MPDRTETTTAALSIDIAPTSLAIKLHQSRHPYCVDKIALLLSIFECFATALVH